MKRGKIVKFGRVRNKRKALGKALATALIEHGRIKTTVMKAKMLSSLSENLVDKAKNGNLASRRILGQYVGAKAVKKLVSDIGPKFKERSGGYTKIIKLGRRQSDGAEMAIVEFVV